MSRRGQQLTVDLTVQPALQVDFYMLDGDYLNFGTTAAVQIEIRDLNGDPFDPDGEVFFQVFRIDNAAPEETPVATGIATVTELEGVPVAGHYIFEFDVSALDDTTPPTQGLVRVSIPYKGSSVVCQKTFQVKSLDDLS